MLVYIGMAVLLVFILIRNRFLATLVKTTQKRVDDNNSAFYKTVHELGAIIKSQQEYIDWAKAYVKMLELDRLRTKNKMDEFMELIPTEVPMQTDGSSAAVVMFQKVDDAIKAIEKHSPDSPLVKELKEIMK